MTDPRAAFGWRRSPPLPDPGSDPELVARMHDEIAREGPVTFARFMERALYEPDLGYYRRARPGPGRAGDFLTAPETHPIFGRALSRQLDEVWRLLGMPSPFVVREHGAGEGVLALSVLDGLVTDGSPLIEAIVVEAVEVEAARTEAFARRLDAAGHRTRQRALTSGRVDGVVLANEVLDALPVHVVEQRDGRLRELLVDRAGDGFVFVPGEPTTPALAARLRDEDVVLREGQRAEISLALDRWVAEAAAGLANGLMLLIDYGHEAAELYGPRRIAGTLAAYVGHRVHWDPFLNVGRQDLTAHVDLTAVQRAAAAAGLEPLGVTTQAEMLIGLGVEELLHEEQADPGLTMERYTALRSGLMRLLDPAATGAFRVLGLGRGLPAAPPLRAFSFRLRRRGA